MQPHTSVIYSLVSPVVILVSIPEPVTSECCMALHGRCGDCSRPTPHCGYRQCNFFGCNCDATSSGRVCRSGGCFRVRKRRDVDDATTSGGDVVRVADADNNGVLSVAEVAAYLQHAHNVTRSKRSLFEDFAGLDRNQDGVLTAEEIDPQQ